jgi:hypothetical protein
MGPTIHKLVFRSEIRRWTEGARPRRSLLRQVATCSRVGLASDQVGHLRCEVEVFGGDAAGVVGGERESDLVITDVDVGVVTRSLSQASHALDEVN